MANEHRGELDVELAGRKVTLRMTFESICEIEETSGKTGIEILQDLSKQKIGVKTMAAILWAGLRATLDPQQRLSSPTLESIGKDVMTTGITKLIGPVGKFIMFAYSTEDDVEDLQSRLGKGDAKDEPTST
jgi:hypothetical protein